MPDFCVQYDAETNLLAVAVHIPGLTTDGALNEGAGLYGDGTLELEWALTPAFSRMNATGQMTTDVFGNSVPAMASDGYRYRLLRWNGDLAALNASVSDAGGTTTQGADASGNLTITIKAGSVTMTYPIPPGTPMSF